MAVLEIYQGDITALDVDAIVNAANTSLLGGGGVDGAIHRTAGPQLLEECRTIGGCPTGEARITSGYRLPARYVIHAVGPVWAGGEKNEDVLLRNCYWNSFELAQKQGGIRSIAFPSISTGVYRFPKERATGIAVETTRQFLKDSDGTIAKVIFCCFSKEDSDLYRTILEKLEN